MVELAAWKIKWYSNGQRPADESLRNCTYCGYMGHEIFDCAIFWNLLAYKETKVTLVLEEAGQVL